MSVFDTPEWQRHFRNILTDIRQKRCVILMGPEMVRMGGMTSRQALRDHLIKANPQEIAHYYERDGFFLFRDKMAKEDVQREVVLFYEANTPATTIEETPFRQLAFIKNHLILSINPDHFLSDTAYKYGIDHSFGYFRHGGEAVDEVEEPTMECPLFYNLCGALERDDSLVLDYEDLFRLLSSLLGSPGLPSKLAVALHQAKHFLFFGFDFDKWYSQLLLRLLSGEKAIRKFAIDPSVKSDNTTAFLVKQFEINFIADEQAFFTELMHRCGEEGLLREPIAANSPARVHVHRLVGSNRIAEALGALESYIHSEPHQNEVTVLRSRHQQLALHRETLDPQEYKRERHRIMDAILHIAAECL